MLLDDKYELLRELGHGGMGVVYEARHRKIGRRVALKLLLPEHAADSEVAARFMTEARAAGSLAHENIAAVYDIGSTREGAPYIVMEYLEGQDCNQLLEAHGRLPVERAIDVLLQVCRGLEAAHGRGIVHRDLKPANLFMTQRGDRSDLVKVLDFGIAKLIDGSSTLHTSTGTAIGTAYYMSPEQARGETDVDQRTDVYALGVIFYELLSGERPFQGDTLLQIVHRILEQNPTPLAERMPELPKGICTVTHIAMAGRREDRYETVAELAHALAQLVRVSMAPVLTVEDPSSKLALQSTHFVPSAAPIAAPIAMPHRAIAPPAMPREGHEPAAAQTDRAVARPQSSSSAALEVTPHPREPSSIGALLIVCVMLVALLGAALAWLLVRQDVLRVPDASQRAPAATHSAVPAPAPAPAPPLPPAPELLPPSTAPVQPNEPPASAQPEPQPADPSPRTPPRAVRERAKAAGSNAQSLSPLCVRLLERQSLGDTLDAQEQAQVVRYCRR